VTSKLASYIDKTIWCTYLALAIVTPLIFTTQNTELYEVPKMLFVYLATTIILFLTLIKFILSGKILIPKNPALAAFAIFVAVQILSTFFSIDKFTSVFGFPSRLNGGLLSQFAYLTIFAAALINLTLAQSKKILAAIVVSALAVSLWGIPAHFGKDPSCLVLTGKLTSACWQKEFDPALRIFSTLGQPNWLASYLVITIPISLSLALAFKNSRSKLFFITTSTILFAALILTNSRSGAIGIGISLLLFLILIGKQTLSKNLKYFLAIFALFILITLLFGTSPTSRISQSLAKKESPQPNLNSQQPSSLPTESSQIRLIVWRGAFLIFKRWPILGSGPETFVSSYYLVRPEMHNQTTEWEFFYNKAHNEFLNYLANTGIFGTISFVVFITITAAAIYKISRQEDTQVACYAKGVLSAFIGYLITIFFGFSVVATQAAMFIAISSVFLLVKNPKEFSIKLDLVKGKIKSTAILASTLVSLIILSFVARLYIGDVFEKRAENFQAESPTRKLLAYHNAIIAFPIKNPYLMADFSTSLGIASTNAQDKKDAIALSQKADENAQDSLNTSPKNYLIAQKVARTYILIAENDKNYQEKARVLGKRLIELAPTYPPAYLTAAKIQIVLNNKQDAMTLLYKALELKDDYADAKELLEQLKNPSIDPST